MSGVGGWSMAGAAAGALFSVGVILIVRGVPVNRRPGLDARLAPYLRDTIAPSRLLASMPRNQTRLSTLLAPLMGDLARRVDRIMGGSASVRRRLQRAGLPPDVEGFRGEQVVWGALGGAVGSALGLLAILARGASVMPVVLLVVASVLLGVIGRDQWLSRQARLREQLMLAEFPTVAELLALAVSAGEGATGALDRVCRLSRGELSIELGRCLADARAGANLPTALQGLADRTGLVSLTRFVDGMVIAAERGTPLAEVLRAQAQDVREAGRRAVMEAGGRKEIAMMIPVVFLVLPVTVLFAVFPGFAFLRLTM
ncbi:MAG: type II secretion system F family protein [Actinomycetales bacterium]|jgi:tight adherence protein C|uniref:Type II secretion system F family protein n=1 Tax=Candidatus Phosphoribacter hodrii TaxID=2953743 RepID=A0A935MI64_9MICO|nr:type II secretion system F family protein [Candidatus Phosphoribacter hodrii]MBP8837691.1 type II secretion system F family protein [Dermatophilaceae bacterium]OPZ54607.1 MAG: Bacterial type II secretion system protein F domain protein [bacterium ADurb.BinA028]MBK7273897.1 type II secretion system F family protein [Candidatus Phosphoribacter hodrii]MBL0004220.1 type II secretion system F family protein [Candidatus Phosphoribacter hodrii]